MGLRISRAINRLTSDMFHLGSSIFFWTCFSQFSYPSPYVHNFGLVVAAYADYNKI